MFFCHHWSFQRSDRISGFGTLGSHYNKISENSEEKEVQRRKEVDDLISKYASKKKVVASQPASDYASTNNVGTNNITSSNINNNNNNDYASIRYGSLRDNLYGTSRENIYGTNARRRSTQYDAYADTTAVTPSNAYVPSYTGAATSSNLYGRSSDVGFNSMSSSASTAGPRRYLATSKSSTNIYLQPNSSSGYDFGGSKNLPDSSRLANRQQKTLSMHGLPSLPSPATQPRMSGGPVLPSSSMSSFHHLLSQQGGSSDWGWNAGSSSLNQHHPYHPVPEPVSAPVSKGLGFWTNPSALIPVN